MVSSGSSPPRKSARVAAGKVEDRLREVSAFCCALSAAGQVGLKVGGPHPPVLKSKGMVMLGRIEMTLGPRELEQLLLR